MGKKLLEQVSDALRAKHYSYRTEQTYIDWIRRYILFHNRRHTKDATKAKFPHCEYTNSLGQAGKIVK